MTASRNFIALMVFMTLSVGAWAQSITQTVRGRVIDGQTRISLPGVNVVIPGTDPVLGTATDMDGYFKLTDVPVGRITLQVSALGYNTVTMANVQLSSGKELVLNVEMEERVVTTKELVIRASKDKTKPLNEMATVSARTFSVEESQRFAGARNDVSRMASNFAGVRGSNDAVNDIVVRGNSPNGLLWRFEGVDIPNPNHFGEFGGTGGPVSMLNNNVMANSDFLTGAFPSEYGNALSGVFDLKMRNGNEEKHEFLGQIGFNGFEFGAEGPISRAKRSSFLVNYRYSTLGVLEAMGINFGTGTAIPQYQDLSFKLNFPMGRKGSLSVFGLGGFSSIDLLASERPEDEENLYNNDLLDAYVRTQSGVIGISHTRILNPKTFAKLTLSASAISNQDIVDSVSFVDNSIHDFYRENVVNARLTASFFVNRKINTKNNVRVGIFANQLRNSLADSVWSGNAERFEVLSDYEGTSFLLQPYAQWQFRPSDRVTFNTGINFQLLTLNGSFSAEPRLGVKWKMNELQSLSLAYGLHSQTAPLNSIHRQVLTETGQYITPNDDLDFAKSHHLVLGYDWAFGENTRLKAEVYYQSIFNAVVEVEPSSFSMLNAGTFNNPIPDFLTNGGTGTNYGVELTLEKFLSEGFYYLITTSLYESTYEGSDGIERNTAFAGNYVANVLAGKEFQLNPNKTDRKFRNAITTDFKVTAAGGQLSTPIDLEASRANNQSVFIDEEAFSNRLPAYFRLDVRVAYRMDGAKYAQEFAFDVQNVTNRRNLFFERYNETSGQVEPVYQLGLFPIVQYKIEF